MFVCVWQKILHNQFIIQALNVVKIWYQSFIRVGLLLAEKVWKQDFGIQKKIKTFLELECSRANLSSLVLWICYWMFFFFPELPRNGEMVLPSSTRSTTQPSSHKTIFWTKNVQNSVEKKRIKEYLTYLSIFIHYIYNNSKEMQMISSTDTLSRRASKFN